MVFRYKCEECRLYFSMGWYHYGLSMKCTSATQLVCTECGVMHRIEHAGGGEGNWFQRMFTTLTGDTMGAQLGPIIDPPESVSTFSPGDWIGEKPVGFLRTAKIFSQLSCMRCHSKGTLRKEWPADGAPCPKCGTHIGPSRSFVLT